MFNTTSEAIRFWQNLYRPWKRCQ